MLLKEQEVAALRRWRRAIADYRPKWESVTAIAALLTAATTFPLAWFSLQQARITAGQLAATRLEQRPWIALEVDTTKTSFYMVPDGLEIELGFKLSNTGHLPARAVFVHTQAWPSPPHSPREADERRTQACPLFLHVGTPVFPGQNVNPPIAYGTTLRWEDMNKIFATLPKTKEQFVFPYVVACATYEDLDGVVHHTPLPLSVFSNRKNHPGTFAVDVDPQHFSQQHILIGPGTSFRMDPD